MTGTLKMDKPHQLGFVVDDIEGGIHEISTSLKVGPFFVLDPFDYQIKYRGADSLPSMALAFTYMRETQIELVCQYNDAPSVYHDFKKKHGTGLVHLGFFVDDPLKYLDAFSAAELIQYGDDGVTKDSYYCKFAGFGGGLVEFTELHDARRKRWEFMKRAAAEWDGTELIRPYSAATQS